MSQPSASLLTRVALSVGAVSAVSALGISVAELGESSLFSLLVLLVEPALWVGFALLALYGLAAGRWLRAASALACLASLSILIRQAPALRVPGVAPDEATPLLRECVSRAGSPSAPATVATWNTGAQRDPIRLAASLRALDADVVVLQEVRGEALLGAVVEQLRALGAPERQVAASEDPPSRTGAMVEGVYVEGMAGSGLGVVVLGGFFGVCGSEERESWSFELPSGGDRRSVAALTMPRVEGVGWVPVLGLHADRPARLGELSGWGDRVIAGGDRLAGFARALDAPGLVLLGDTNAHLTFRRFAGAMLGANLNELSGGPTWPATLFGLPALPLYRLDRVWVGAGWAGGSAETIRLPGSEHLAVVARLEPRAGAD